MLDYFAASVALKPTAELANSALPDAPVRPGLSRSDSRGSAARRLTAKGLFRLANWMEPSPVR